MNKIFSRILITIAFLSLTGCGIYKEYEVKKLVIIVAAIVYVVTPIDFLPDFMPPGLIDDLSILAWAVKEAASELGRYKELTGRTEKETEEGVS
mgnify:CR=1 FL=1